MTALGLYLVWTAAQVSLVCLAGMVLYLVVRRHSPAAGAWAATAVLATTVVVSAVGLSPWPHWWSLGQQPTRSIAIASTENNETANQASGPIATAGDSGNPSVAANSTTVDGSPVGSSAGRDWRAFWDAFRSARPENETDTAIAWSWAHWLALVVSAGWAIGLARLVIAVSAVGHYRTLARAVSDAAVLEMLDDLRGELDCRRPIELREVSVSCSPLTVGSLRPMIVLPGDWRDWTPGELRAVLAHEVSHVARGDFAAWLVAQFGVALHFYNPLVHWMARRLRLEQDMAADVCGAELAGGRQVYLTTLAQMAIRHDAPPVSWAARPFLPTRGTLMRRIEMLHRQRQLPSRSVSISRRSDGAHTGPDRLRDCRIARSRRRSPGQRCRARGSGGGGQNEWRADESRLRAERRAVRAGLAARRVGEPEKSARREESNRRREALGAARRPDR